MRSKQISRTLGVAAALALMGAGLALSATESPAPEPARGAAWLGVWLEDAVDGGVEIVAVVPGGPAARSRLRPGDIILRANRVEIPVQDALRAVLVRLEPGDPLELQLLRAGRELEARVTLVSRAPEAAALPRVQPKAPVAPDPPRFWPVRPGGLRRAGLQVADVTPALRVFYGAPEDAGVLVTRAESGKPAGESGIRVGDILVRLGDRKLASEDQLDATLERWNPGQPLSIVVVREGKARTLSLASEASGVAEVSDSSERRKREREILTGRLQRELARLELRIAEIRRELEALREEP